MVRSVDVYLRNPEFIKNMLKFIEMSCILLFTLNNKKYNRTVQNFEKIELYEFSKDFYDNIDVSETTELSILPLYIIKNIFQATLLVRKYYPEALLADYDSTRIIVYFAIIYSSQIDLLTNPHLRSEIFDILVYCLIVNSEERNAKQSNKIFLI